MRWAHLQPCWEDVDWMSELILDLQAELTELAAIEAEAIGYPSHEGQVF